MWFIRDSVIAALILFVTCTTGFANDQSFVPADTTSPQATFKSFVEGCNEFHELTGEVRHFDRQDPRYRPVVRKILDCLDTSELPDYARQDLAAEAAVYLKEIVDRVELPPLEEIPDTAQIQEAGGPEKLARWRIPGTRIVIAHVDDGPRKYEYLFSPGTVERAEEYFEDLRGFPYRESGPPVSQGLYEWYVSAPGNPVMAVLVDRLPTPFHQVVWSVAVWKWIGLVLAVVATYSIMRWTWRVRWRLAGPDDSSWRGLGAALLCRGGLVLIPLAFKIFVWDFLTIRGTMLYAVSFCANLLALFFGMLLLSNLINRIAERIIASPRIAPEGLDAQFVRIIARLGSVAVALILFLEGGRYLGIPLTTLIASAGITGLAIALAAQETLKNVFGSMMILLDKPYKVGERIIVKGYDGIVEEVGLRSTKIRTFLLDHLVTITNDEMARSDIENLGRRNRVHRRIEILIPIDTPFRQVKQAVDILREKLESHPGLDAEMPPKVFFDDFDPAGFRLQAHYWYGVSDYWERKTLSENLNFEIFQAFEDAGIAFSLPFRHSYWKQDDLQGPLDVRVLSDESAAEKNSQPIG